VWGAALPDARVHLFDEFKMVRLSIKDAAEQIRERCLRTWKLGQMPSIYCDPALRIKTGQIGEDYIQTFARHRVILTPVSNNRHAGWQRIHEALREMPGMREPWLTIHPRCKYLIRTIPAMIQDSNDPEDLDTDSDDHGCLVGDTPIAMAQGEMPIAQIQPGMEVRTRRGLRRVTSAGQTGETKTLWHIVTSHGVVLRGTGNHPVFVPDRGFVRMDSLRYGDILEPCQTSHIVIETPVLHGDAIEDPSRPDGTSTTKTTIPETTPWITWSASLRSIISAGMERAVPLRLSITRSFWQPLVSGISLTLVARGIAPMLALCGRVIPSPQTRPVFIVEGASWTGRGNRPDDSVATTVSLPSGDVSVWTMNVASATSAGVPSPPIDTFPRGPVRAPVVTVVAAFPVVTDAAVPVYNLSVEDVPEYYAHGVLTHNCDAVRYLLMGGLRAGSKAMIRPVDAPGSWGAFKRMMKRTA
jgi:hypothetical protein